MGELRKSIGKLPEKSLRNAHDANNIECFGKQEARLACHRLLNQSGILAIIIAMQMWIVLFPLPEPHLPLHRSPLTRAVMAVCQPAMWTLAHPLRESVPKPGV